MKRAILVGIDGSPGAAAALRWALGEAGRRDLPVEALLAWSYLDQHDAVGDRGFDPGYGEPEARDALAAFVEAAVGDDADVRRVVVCDTPARALAERSREATMVVVGATGHGRFPGLRLGSTSDRLLTDAACPVVVVRGPDGEGPVVVGVDGSPDSARVIRWAAEEAACRDRRLYAVSAWEAPTLALWAFNDDSPYFARFAEQQADRLEEALAAVDTHELHVERRVVEGSAAGAILDVEEEVGAGLVVVGSRGMASVPGALLGSVSRQVAHHAQGPVLVVRP